MSTHAARKLMTIVRNVQAVLAIEMMVGAQALEWRVALRNGVGEAHTLEDAEEQAAAFARFVQSADIASYLGTGTRTMYRNVRERVATLLNDRPLSDDVRKLRELT